jgi:hypothetical protein
MFTAFPSSTTWPEHESWTSSPLVHSTFYPHIVFLQSLTIHFEHLTPALHFTLGQNRKMATKMEKGKGKASSGSDPDAGSSTLAGTATSSTDGNNSTPSLRRGHPLDAIKQALQTKLRIGTLPYLNNLNWMPTNDKGALEKLRIGTRDGYDVFAVFDAKPPDLNKQLHIVQANGVGKHREITKATWSSIDLIAPYTYLAQQILSKQVAHFIRTFIKACFALRGHSAGHIVSVDLESFVRCAAIIHRKGYGSAAEDISGASDSSIRSTIEVRDASSVSGTLLMVARVLPQALRKPLHRKYEEAISPFRAVVLFRPSSR